MHNKMTNYYNGEKIGNIKIVRSVKVLGYILDEHCNNLEHIDYIKNKIEKARKLT